MPLTYHKFWGNILKPLERKSQPWHCQDNHARIQGNRIWILAALTVWPMGKVAPKRSISTVPKASFRRLMSATGERMDKVRPMYEVLVP
jgi:hypothetical protein